MDAPLTGELSLLHLRAVVFDLDGVLTDTASLHRRAWKETFDAFLRGRGGDDEFDPFTAEDYRRYVDGKPRYEGARSFLEARDVDLPFGDPGDPPAAATVCGLASRKNERFLELLAGEGPNRYESSVEAVRRLRELGLRTAVVSSSRNGARVLEAAGMAGLFDVCLDGRDAEELELPGKPDPGVFEAAAARLDVDPARAAVVEDAIAGVEAARRGGFGLVVGVDRTGHGDALREAGADVVVGDLADLRIPARRPIRELPAALAREEELRERLSGRTIAVFLDYDGTLTPIVDDPDRALLPRQTRETLARLSRRVPVAIMSGRDLPDVGEKVGLQGVWYAGSHGFDVRGPGGLRWRRGEAYLPALDDVHRELEERLGPLDGVLVERKRYAVAVHFRRASAEAEPAVRAAVRDVAGGRDDLRVTGGKKIREVRPDLDWDKGRALLKVLGRLTPGDGDLLPMDLLPIYVGDDVTDEDAFRVLAGRGLALVVRGEDDERPSLADYSLEDPDAVRRFLELLLTLEPGPGEVSGEPGVGSGADRDGVEAGDGAEGA